ncbi:hypothetical protein GCM10023215_67220 [Pseudonocardia yuanmonensis]|uniref:HTH iclR-type domain-containing protein n=1 Tax=Pseudonocardia yuanmonensis TaxID=1095914 RepID=A0ABP8XSS4_9PSEU
MTIKAPKSDGSQPDPAIRAVERVAQVLALFDGPSRSITPRAAVEQLDLRRSTAYRYLRALEQAGLLHRDRNGQLIPGPVLRRLAPRPTSTHDLVGRHPKRGLDARVQTFST